ncbi:unnamed protein product [Coregonus sp. 'balchen']|nr:unnamed protein product [Coregonus sp. 'balchen']
MGVRMLRVERHPPPWELEWIVTAGNSVMAPAVPVAPPQHLKPGEIPPEAFIIPGSPAIISIRQQGGEDDKSDFITFGKKEEAKKKKKKKKEKKDKKDKGKDDDE